MLLQALTVTDPNGDIEILSRAASVLSHILKDNVQCKERVLRVKLESEVPSLGAPEPLFHRIMKNLVVASSTKNKCNNQNSRIPSEDAHIHPLIFRLLIIWLADCPSAVNCFLESPAHLELLLELVTSPLASSLVRGLAAIILGECVLYNKLGQNNKDAFFVVDVLSQKLGLSSYFLKFDELKNIFLSHSSSIQHRKPLARSNAASMEDVEETDNDETNQKNEHQILIEILDPSFNNFVGMLEAELREAMLGIFGNTRNKVTVLPAELEQKNGEADRNYIRRLKSFVENQRNEMMDLLGRNATLAEELARTGGGSSSDASREPGGDMEKVQSGTLHRDLQEATRRIDILESEKAKIEAEASDYRDLVEKLEADLKSLSNAYNSLEQINIHMEIEAKALRKGGGDVLYPDIEAIKAAAREEAEKESEAELNDLLVCLGQEETKVEKLSARLAELGEDVDSLLEGIGDDAGFHDAADDDGDGKNDL